MAYKAHTAVAGVEPVREAGQLYALLCKRTFLPGCTLGPFLHAHPWRELKAMARAARLESKEAAAANEEGGCIEGPVTTEGVLLALETTLRALLLSAKGGVTGFALSAFHACTRASLSDGFRFRKEKEAAVLAAAFGPEGKEVGDAMGCGGGGGGTEVQAATTFLVTLPIAEIEGGGLVSLGAHEGGPRDAPIGRPAETHVMVLKNGFFQGRKVSLLQLSPTSGRRHQLRLHCQALGHCIVGDATYRSSGAGDTAAAAAQVEAQLEAAPRMYLHAWRLELDLAWMKTCCKRENKRGQQFVKAREARGGGLTLEFQAGAKSFEGFY